jgi:predicted GNAT family N-acyltransferase
VSAEVRRARDAQELAAALALREEVFVGEQGVSAEGDRDGRDEEAVQLVVTGTDGTVVATARILVDAGRARFGRLCVRRDLRGRGIARSLLAEAEREARAAGCTAIGLHAQTDALQLYLDAGYEPYGERFEEEGIEHQAMEKRLA